MMKFVYKVALFQMFCFTSVPALADDTLNQYLQNFGTYFGYDITVPPKVSADAPASPLINLPLTQSSEFALFNSFLGASLIPPLLASTVPGAGAIATTFKAYNTAGSIPISINPLIDQQTYQQDPVSQAVMNILTTPDYSNCLNFDQTAWIPDCQLLYQNKVMMNVLGKVPSYDPSIPPGLYFSATYNQAFLSQLNINTLLSPLIYSTDAPNTNPFSSIFPGANTGAGLTAQNQAQEAANFVRYVTGSVAPGSLPNFKDFSSLYQLAFPTTAPANGPTMAQISAQNTLATYFTNLRIYAAQSSVGIGNLYYMLSKRMPQSQTDASGNTSPTSEALSEFNMATWRIKPTDPSMKTTAWVNQLNGASSATVQKEIAILLAEINYQLYLNRVQDERMLLTNSMMLIQNTKIAQPTASFSVQNSAAGAVPQPK